MQQRRNFVLALLVAATLTGCTTGPGAPTPLPSPTAATSAAETPSPTPTPEAIPLTEAKVARAFAEVAVPAGFRVDIQCPPKTAQDKRICATPTDNAVAWSASRTYLGPKLPGASGFPATVTINLTAARTEAAADALYERAVRGLRARDGKYNIPLKRKSDTYTPGKRGRGTLTSKSSGNWRGVELNEKSVLVFDTSTSKKVTSGTRLQRRGVYFLDVAWTAAKPQAVADLADLPDRVATALDRAG